MLNKPKSTPLPQLRRLQHLLLVLLLIADPNMNQGAVGNDEINHTPQEQTIFATPNIVNGAAPVIDVHALQTTLQTIQEPLDTQNGEQLADLHQQIQRSREENIEIRGCLEEVRRQNERLVQQAEQSLGQAGHIEELQGQNRVLREEIVALRVENQQLRVATQNGEQIEDLHQQIQRSREENIEMRGCLEEVRRQNERLVQQAEQSIAEAAVSRGQVQELQGHNEQLRKSICRCLIC